MVWTILCTETGAVAFFLTLSEVAIKLIENPD